MPPPQRTEVSSELPDEPDFQTDLAKLFGDSVKALVDVRAMETGGTRLFFPDGIQYIKLGLTVGPKDAPLFSAELEISGDKAKPAALKSNEAYLALQPTIFESTARGTIAQTCIDEWPDHKDYCNQFVIAVAQTFGVALSGQADDILEQVSGGDWTSLTDGPAASAAAADGKLVVGGLSSVELNDTHGHVVIVVPPTGPLAFGKYPYAYWGSENPAIRDKGGEGTTLNWSFSKAVRDRIRYASRSL